MKTLTFLLAALLLSVSPVQAGVAPTSGHAVVFVPPSFDRDLATERKRLNDPFTAYPDSVTDYLKLLGYTVARGAPPDEALGTITALVRIGQRPPGVLFIACHGDYLPGDSTTPGMPVLFMEKFPPGADGEALLAARLGTLRRSGVSETEVIAVQRAPTSSADLERESYLAITPEFLRRRLVMKGSLVVVAACKSQRFADKYTSATLTFVGADSSEFITWFGLRSVRLFRNLAGMGDWRLRSIRAALRDDAGRQLRWSGTGELVLFPSVMDASSANGDELQVGSPETIYVRFDSRMNTLVDPALVASIDGAAQANSPAWVDSLTLEVPCRCEREGAATLRITPSSRPGLGAQAARSYISLDGDPAPPPRSADGRWLREGEGDPFTKTFRCVRRARTPSR